MRTRVLDKESSILTSISQKDPSASISRLSPRFVMSVVLIASDLCAVFFVVLMIALSSRLLTDKFEFGSYLNPIMLTIILILVYAWRGLYPGIGMNRVEELRKLTLATSFVFLIIGTSGFLSSPGQDFSRYVYISIWLLALIFVPVSRALIRSSVKTFSWWGDEVAVLNYGNPELDMCGHLTKYPEIGLKPVIVFDLEPSRDYSNLVKNKVVCDQIKKYCEMRSIRCGLIATNISIINFTEDLDHFRSIFQRLVLVDVRPRTNVPWASSLDLAGIPGLEIRHRLLDKETQVLKRLIDISASIIGILFFMPFLLSVGIFIKLDSAGPILFLQERVGRGGKIFKMFKLRTMYEDAEDLLQSYLRQNEDLDKEWMQYQKLRKDPRVTRVGKWLRKFSFDELPQLLNVLRGEMSIVGPRPYFPEQQDDYGKGYESYILVPPGITGMWQVSGRNHTTFATRIQMDEYYVRNWSIWLDIYLLARTIPTVLSRSGAF